MNCITAGDPNRLNGVLDLLGRLRLSTEIAALTVLVEAHQLPSLVLGSVACDALVLLHQERPWRIQMVRFEVTHPGPEPV